MSDIKLIKDGIEYVPIEPTYTGEVIRIIYGGKTYQFKPIKKGTPKGDYYELFSYGKGVNSVKRHSDGEIYSIGDYAEVRSNDGLIVSFIIRKFELEPNGDLMVCLLNHSARYNLSLLEPKAKSKEKDIPKIGYEVMTRYAKINHDEVGSTDYSSVRRISDNEYFLIGDIVEKYGTVMSFRIIAGDLYAYCKNAENHRSYISIDLLQHLPKPKVPLFTFTTHDGVKIVEGDDISPVVAVDENNYAFYSSFYLSMAKDFPTRKYFFDYRKAIEWIQLNKPIEVSYKELEQVLIKNYYPYDNFEDIRTFFKSKINP